MNVNFDEMISSEEKYLGITLGNKERLLVENLLRDLLAGAIEIHSELEAESDKLTTQLVSYEATIGYLREKLEEAGIKVALKNEKQK